MSIENSSENDLIIEGYTNINDLYKMIQESIQNDMMTFEAAYRADTRELGYTKLINEAKTAEDRRVIKEAEEKEKNKAAEGMIGNIKNLIAKFVEKISSIIENVATKLYKFFTIKIDFANKHKDAFNKADMSNYKSIDYYPYTSSNVVNVAKRFKWDIIEKTLSYFNMDVNNKSDFETLVKCDKEPEFIKELILSANNDSKALSYDELKSSPFILLEKKNGNPFNDISLDKASILAGMKTDSSKEIRTIKNSIKFHLAKYIAGMKVFKTVVELDKGKKSEQRYSDDSGVNRKDDYITMYSAVNKIFSEYTVFCNAKLATLFKEANIIMKQELMLFKEAVKVGNGGSIEKSNDDKESQNASAIIDLEVDELCEACNECFYGE